MRPLMRGIILTTMLAILPVLSGCSEQEKRGSMRQRQDAAMADPWNYSPYEGQAAPKRSGSGILDMDSEGLKRDFNSVLGP
jgi:hypothetical protein